MDLVWLKDIVKGDIDRVGSKAYYLSQLYQAKLPVPNGFVITSDIFKSFLQINGIDKQIDAIFDKVEEAYEDDVKYGIDAIQNLILKYNLPTHLESEIMEAYNNFSINLALHRGLGQPALSMIKAGRDLQSVVVRSESLANINVIDVKGIESLKLAIKKCWASTFDVNCILKLKVQNKNPSDLNIPIFVQKMIYSDRSGKSVTNKSEVSIGAIWGLPGLERLEGSAYSVQNNSYHILDTVLKEQPYMYVKDNYLNRIIKRSIPMHSLRVLDDQEVRDIARTTKDIENNLGFPVKVHWAIEDRKLSILKTQKIEMAEEPAKEEITTFSIDELYNIIESLEQQLSQLKNKLSYLKDNPS